MKILPPESANIRVDDDVGVVAFYSQEGAPVGRERYFSQGECSSLQDEVSVAQSIASAYGCDDVTSTNSFVYVQSTKPNLNDDLVQFWQLREEGLKHQKLALEQKLLENAEREKRLYEKYRIYQHEDAQAEREALREIWQREFQAELNESRWYNQFKRNVAEKRTKLCNTIKSFFITVETFMSNLPLTIGAIGLAWVTMGVVWFKFAEENLASCTPVHFHSVLCTFPEFPGCFYCSDTSDFFFQSALRFHYVCDGVGAVVVLCFFAKAFLAWKGVADELSNPTTSAPAGLICISTIVVSAGHGALGEGIVLVASSIYACFALRFFSMVYEHKMMPDPSWFPNTVGIGYAAVKTYLYYPTFAKVFLGISVCSFFASFPVSVFRVYFNRKIAPQVCWIQISAPSITLYALTILSQPSVSEEQLLSRDQVEHARYVQWQRTFYLPLMQFFFALTMLGVLSSVHGAWVRRKALKEKPFTPAHAIFGFPILSHANAIQSYRGALRSFTLTRSHTMYLKMIYGYWLFVLVAGTVVTFVITVKFLKKLPSWTQVDVAEEKTFSLGSDVLGQLLNAGESFRQQYVSPSVLQANEAGTLIRVRRDQQDERGRYVRTRQISSVGFEPTLSWDELVEETDYLLDWVAHNSPRPRDRTVSTPGPSTLYGTYQSGIEAGMDASKHKRIWTLG